MADEEETMGPDEKETNGGPPQNKGLGPAPPAAGGNPGAAGPGGGLGQFLFQFLKANPDIAREMSTRMNAIINGQRLQGMRGGAAAGGIPGQMPRTAAPVVPPRPVAAPPTQGLPVANPAAMGIRGAAPSAMPPPAMAAARPPVAGNPAVQSAVQQWIANMKARQGPRQI